MQSNVKGYQGTCTEAEAHATIPSKEVLAGGLHLEVPRHDLDGCDVKIFEHCLFLGGLQDGNFLKVPKGSPQHTVYVYPPNTGHRNQVYIRNLFYFMGKNIPVYVLESFNKEPDVVKQKVVWMLTANIHLFM